MRFTVSPTWQEESWSYSNQNGYHKYMQKRDTYELYVYQYQYTGSWFAGICYDGAYGNIEWSDELESAHNAISNLQRRIKK